MSDGKTVSEIFGPGDLRDRMRTMWQLRDESGACVLEARDALTETGFDIEEARRLLKERGQWKTLETRKAHIAERIADLEEHKRLLQEWYEQDVADYDRQIAELKEELSNLG